MHNEKHRHRFPHGNSLLNIVSKRAKLEEGGEAVRRMLREVFRHHKLSTKKLASLSYLPVPVTAAVRRELEKEGLLARNGGAFLTDKGEKFVKEKLGLVYREELACPTCSGRTIQIPNVFAHVIEKLRVHLETRPKPLPWLDQTHGTPETALLRALYMLEKGDVEGREIIFLGDDDFTSIAVGLLNAAKKVTVVDSDSRLLRAIQDVSDQENLNITCVKLDLRHPLPTRLRTKFDVVFTDPPYTLAGVTLFVSRGITALQRRKSACIYLAYAHQSPKKMLMVQRTLSAMSLVMVEHLPRFNVYEGAEMFANTTFLARLETTEKTKPYVTGTFNGKLYTGEITKTLRTYQCRCGRQTKVGATEKNRTIEELKEKGCPTCGKTKGFKLVKKLKLKEFLSQNLVVRNFGWADFPEVLEFEREIARKSFPEAPLLAEEYHRRKLEKATIKEPRSVKVAVLDGEIVGWLWLRTEKDRNTNEKFGYIKTISVKPKHRRQGFGRRLMEAAKNYFVNKGICRLDLIVSATNHEATLFFEEVGFEGQHCTMRKKLKK